MTGTAADGSPDESRPAALRVAEDAVARAMVGDALWPVGATVVVAVSGGADSLCLLGTLLALRKAESPGAPGEIVVATLDHGLRGAAGAADARWVEDLTARLGLRCVAERVDAHALAQANHLSQEDAARRLRYAFLRRVARDVSAARICLGHTLDDQAETVILHLLRGSGLDGLAGMRPVRGDLARPLLELTHTQAVAYCAARGWLPREDLTNRDERYLRNRVRRRLVPLLEAYNPNIRRTLARNAAVIADDLALLEAATDRAWTEMLVGEAAATLTLRLTAVREAPPALRRRVLRRAALRLTTPPTADGAIGAPGLSGLEARHVALIERFIACGRTGGALTLPGGLRVGLGYDTLSVTRAPGEQPGGAATSAEPSDGVWTVSVPGVVNIPALGWRVRATPLTTPPGLEGDPLPPIPREAPLAHAGTAASGHRGELRVYLDADCLDGALTVRAWRPGDRFRPLGMASEKKLQDVFSDAKVTRDARRRLPIVCAGERIVWVVGVRIADDVRLTQTTRHTLALQAEPLRDEPDEMEESET